MSLRQYQITSSNYLFLSLLCSFPLLKCIKFAYFSAITLFLVAEMLGNQEASAEQVFINDSSSPDGYLL